MKHRWADYPVPSDADMDALIDEIEARSYVVIPNVITPEEADEARETLRRLCEEKHGTEDVPKLERLGQIAAKDQIFRDLLCHPLPVNVWRRYIGVDMYCSTWTGITLHPGYPDGDWHSDYPFWSMKAPYIADRIAVQTIWLLDDFTEENGGTGVVPGGHRVPYPPNDERAEWPAEPEVVTGQRGSLVLAHGAWWHRPRANSTDAPRSGLLGMYVRPCIIPQEPLRKQLEMIDDPSDELVQIMGGNTYEPHIIDP